MSGGWRRCGRRCGRTAAAGGRQCPSYTSIAPPPPRSAASPPPRRLGSTPERRRRRRRRGRPAPCGRTASFRQAQPGDGGRGGARAECGGGGGGAELVRQRRPAAEFVVRHQQLPTARRAAAAADRCSMMTVDRFARGLRAGMARPAVASAARRRNEVMRSGIWPRPNPGSALHPLAPSAVTVWELFALESPSTTSAPAPVAPPLPRNGEARTRGLVAAGTAR